MATEAPRSADTRTARGSGQNAPDRRGTTWTYRGGHDKQPQEVGNDHKDRGGNTPHDVLSA